MPKSFTIDGQKFVDLEGFYAEIESILTKGLDWKIGRNLDAFNDVLRGGFGAFDYEELIELIWTNSDKSKSDLSWIETIKYVESKLLTCHESNIEYVKSDLELARNHKGQTLFDILIEIIKEQEHIRLELR